MDTNQSAASSTLNLLALIRQTAPMVQVITNTVAAPLSANLLRALGALPVMSSFKPELPAILQSAQALVLNLGTPDRERSDTLRHAARIAFKRGLPVVLDPVGAALLPRRRFQALRFLSLLAGKPMATPIVLRCNRLELLALAGSSEKPARAALNTLASPSSAALDAAAETLLRQFPGLATGGAIIVGGESDLLWTGTARFAVSGGSPLTAQLSGKGCAFGAVLGAFLGSGHGYFPLQDACKAACLAFRAAAARAQARSAGPGSLVPALIDAISSLTIEDFSNIAISGPAARGGN